MIAESSRYCFEGLPKFHFLCFPWVGQSISPAFVILYALLHELDTSLLFDLAMGKLAK
jgi:hypothetical protein